MSKTSPSLLALLGLVAFAGYQNRDRIGQMLADARQDAATPGAPLPAERAGLVAEIAHVFQGSPVSSALGDLVEKFRASGTGSAADSWVSDKANAPLGVDTLATALGDDTLRELSQKTGLSRAELLLRLNVTLPQVVNRFTPLGRLPTADEAQAFA